MSFVSYRCQIRSLGRAIQRKCLQTTLSLNSLCSSTVHNFIEFYLTFFEFTIDEMCFFLMYFIFDILLTETLLINYDSLKMYYIDNTNIPND